MQTQGSTADTIIFPEASDIFKPYKVLDEGLRHVHLVVTAARKILFVFTFNVMPLIIICLLIPLAVYEGEMFSGIKILFPLSALLVAILLLFKKTIYEVNISDTRVDIKGARFFKGISQQVMMKDIDSIFLSVVYGRGGGAFFKLNMKSGIKIEFLVIPLMVMNNKRIRALCGRLVQVTGLRIEGNLSAHGMFGDAIQ